MEAPSPHAAACSSSDGTRLRASGISVEELSLHLPSLDEVFFTLTGTRSAGDARTASEVTV